MNLIHTKNVLAKTIGFKFAYHGIIKPPRPSTLTFSVTSACQSLCKTCNIGLHYQQNPSMLKDDLTLDEIEKIFKAVGEIYFFNISGGEPFLRRDLPEIVDLACKYIKPKVIHTPTNALTPSLIEKKTREILEVIKKNKSNIPFTIKPSYDGVGKQHDEIRGVKGNWEKLLETISRLKKLQKEYQNLYLGLGTVISRFNVKDIQKIADYAHNLSVDSYINEVAENRAEMFNLKDTITPSHEEYQEAMKYFSTEVKKRLKEKKMLVRFTDSFRIVYYDLVVDILREKKQVIPCYAGISNVHINAKGQIWSCCVLGYDHPMADLREYNYDFNKAWQSEQANKVRKYIKDRNCACPLANQSYSNILLDIKSMGKVVKNIISA